MSAKTLLLNIIIGLVFDRLRPMYTEGTMGREKIDTILSALGALRSYDEEESK